LFKVGIANQVISTLELNLNFNPPELLHKRLKRKLFSKHKAEGSYMTVNVEIICIGNELLIGKIMNTNAQWLAAQTTNLGANVQRITVIQDNLTEIANAINEAKTRKPTFIITTGGLGPTFDDMTLQGVAKALGCKLELNPSALKMVKQRCIEYAKKRGLPTDIELTPPRIKMAKFPEKTQPVTNPIGTAPGLRAEIDDALLFVLPGVPIEMETIFTETIASLIKHTVGEFVFCQSSLYLAGIMESQLAPLIDYVMAANKDVYIKSHPAMGTENKPYTELHLTMRTNQPNPTKKLEKATKEIMELIKANAGKVSFEPY
jgi:nicotinamide-nucleotide amidase